MTLSRIALSFLVLLLGIHFSCDAQETGSAGKDETYKTDPAFQKQFDKAEQTYTYADRIVAFQKAFAASGGHCVPCLLEASRCAFRGGDEKNGLKTLDQLLSLDGASPRAKSTALLDAAAHYLRHRTDKNGKEYLDKAFDYLQRASQADPTYYEAPLMYARALLDNGRKDEGTAVLHAMYQNSQLPRQARLRAVDYIKSPDSLLARHTHSFQVTGMDGRKITVSDLGGPVTLLLFCQTMNINQGASVYLKYMTWLEQFYQVHKNYNFQMLTLFVGSDREDGSRVVAKLHPGWTHFVDSGSRVSSYFAFEETPAAMVIDGDGEIIFQQRLPAPGLAEAVDGALKKASSAQKP